MKLEISAEHWMNGDWPPSESGYYICCIYDEEPTVTPSWDFRVMWYGGGGVWPSPRLQPYEHFMGYLQTPLQLPERIRENMQRQHESNPHPENQ